MEDVLRCTAAENAGAFLLPLAATALKLGLEQARRRAAAGTGSGDRAAEDRGQFSAILKDLGVAQPEGAVRSWRGAEAGRRLGTRHGRPASSWGAGDGVVESEPDEGGSFQAFEPCRSVVLVDRFVSGTEYELTRFATGRLWSRGFSNTWIRRESIRRLDGGFPDLS